MMIERKATDGFTSKKSGTRLNDHHSTGKKKGIQKYQLNQNHK